MKLFLHNSFNFPEVVKMIFEQRYFSTRTSHLDLSLSILCKEGLVEGNAIYLTVRCGLPVLLVSRALFNLLIYKFFVLFFHFINRKTQCLAI